MKLKSESHLHNYLRGEAANRGVLCDKLESRSRSGWPDILLAYGGRCLFVELKSPLGGVVSALQTECMEDMEKHGLECWVVDSAELAITALDRVCSVK